MESLLEIDSVIKSYGNRRILTDISMRCRPGDIIGLLGRNGTGKSTILKILFGTLYTDIKFIRIDGQVLNRPYLKKGLISYLPQDGLLPRNLTVEQAVRLFKKSEAKTFLEDEIIYRVRKTRIGYLSGGEERYIETKLILESGSKYILLDEPFNGISPLMIDKVKEMIKARTPDVGIILTDHDYRNVLDVANRLYLLYDGTLRGVKDPGELVQWGYLPEN